MDEVQLILTALGAGAAAAGAGTVQGLSDSARAAVVEALTALRERLTDRLDGRPAAADAARDERVNPEQALAASGATQDPAILELARRILDLLPSSASASRYEFHGDVRGLQVNERGGGVQHNTFS
jgi:hypothetical protein